MENQPRHTALARWLRDLLHTGIPVTQDVLAFIEATFGTENLDTILAEEAGSEIDSLMELIFFPDRTTQIQFERHWGHISFSPADLQATIDALCLKPLDVTLKPHWPAGRRLIMRAPDFALESFVKRLNITRQPPSELVQAVQRHAAAKRRLALRVSLRNARLAWHPNQVALTRRFLNTECDSDADPEPLLDFLLALLPDLSRSMDHFDFLVSKKFFFFQSLCKAQDFERKRQTSNMETMMLQGARSAHGNISEWRLCMRHIDQLCQAMFGHTRFFHQPAEQCIDLHHEKSCNSMQQVIRALS